MSLIYLQPYKLSGPGPVSGRSFRLVSLGATQGGVIGVFEFELYNSSGQNLCRTAGFVPTITPSANSVAFPEYGPERTIDGQYSPNGSWTGTGYMNARADGSSFFEYTFPQDISPISWRMMPEGAWLPTNNGIKLQALKNDVWVDITGTSNAGAWSNNVWRSFTIPALV